MEYSHALLIERIKSKYGTITNFCVNFKCSRQTMYLKLNNKIPFSINDIEKMISPEFLDIPKEQIHIYFFSPKIKYLER